MGFQYSDKTFDDLFVSGWKNAGAVEGSLSSASEDSEQEEEKTEVVEAKAEAVKEETKQIFQESYSEIKKIE